MVKDALLYIFDLVFHFFVSMFLIMQMVFNLLEFRASFYKLPESVAIVSRKLRVSTLSYGSCSI